jgi:hypothetical protein
VVNDLYLDTNVTDSKLCEENVLRKSYLQHQAAIWGIWWDPDLVASASLNGSQSLRNQVYLCSLPSLQGKCLIVNASGAPGSLGGFVPSCADGSSGRLCQLCVPGTTKVSGVCQPCVGNSAWEIVKVLIGFLIVVAMAEYLLSSTEHNRRPTKELLWFLFDFAQWINLLFLLRFKWPVGVLNLFQGLQTGLDVAETLSVSCMFSFSHYERLAFTVSSVVTYPLIFVMYTVLKYFFVRLVLRQTDRRFWEWVFEEKNYHRSLPKAFTFLFTCAFLLVSLPGCLTGLTNLSTCPCFVFLRRCLSKRHYDKPETLSMHQGVRSKFPALAS